MRPCDTCICICICVCCSSLAGIATRSGLPQPVARWRRDVESSGMITMDFQLREALPDSITGGVGGRHWQPCRDAA